MIVQFHETWITGDAMANFSEIVSLFFTFSGTGIGFCFLFSVVYVLLVFSVQSAKGHFKGRHDNDASTATPAGTAYHTPSCALAQVSSHEGSTEFILGGRRRATSINGSVANLFRGFIFFLLLYHGIVTYGGLSFHLN